MKLLLTTFIFILFYYIYTKIGKERGNSYQKNEEISSWKAHTNIWKFHWNVSTITDDFLNQKRVNVCEHTIKTRVFTYIYSLWLKKTLWSKHFSETSMCLCVPFIWRFFIFLIRIYSFFSYLCYPYFGTFPFHMALQETIWGRIDPYLWKQFKNDDGDVLWSWHNC